MLDEKELEENQEKFIEIFNKYITREGAGNLLDWLINIYQGKKPQNVNKSPGQKVM